jgi:hypothetical protein
LRDDADLEPVALHEFGDDAGGEVGLAGAGRALDGEVGVVEVEHGRGDGRDVILIDGSGERA